MSETEKKKKKTMIDALYISPLQNYIIKLCSDPLWNEIFEGVASFMICEYWEDVGDTEGLSPWVIIRHEDTFDDCVRWLKRMNIISNDEMKNTIKSYNETHNDHS